MEEESKRLRNELSEEKARHKFDVDKVTVAKEEELEEVHKRFVPLLFIQFPLVFVWEGKAAEYLFQVQISVVFVWDSKTDIFYIYDRHLFEFGQASLKKVCAITFHTTLSCFCLGH